MADHINPGKYYSLQVRRNYSVHIFAGILAIWCMSWLNKQTKKNRPYFTEVKPVNFNPRRSVNTNVIQTAATIRETISGDCINIDSELYFINLQVTDNSLKAYRI